MTRSSPARKPKSRLRSYRAYGFLDTDVVSPSHPADAEMADDAEEENNNNAASPMDDAEEENNDAAASLMEVEADGRRRSTRKRRERSYSF